jgi:general secretion pathway protein C
MFIRGQTLSVRIMELGLITVVAFLVADIAALLIEQRLDVPVLSAVSIASPDPPLEESSPRALMTSVMQRRLFGQASDPSEAQRHRPRLPVSQRMRLLGTIVGDPSYAILEDVNTLHQDLYRLHDRLDGTAHIAAIERNKITVASGSSVEILEVSVQEGGVAKAVEPVPIPETLARRVVLDRELVQGGYENLSKLMTQGRVTPSFDNGKPNGFLVREIATGSLFDRAGLRNNDVLQRINGVEVNDPETLFKMFLALKDDSSIALDVLRAGRVQTYAYEIR